MSGQTGHPLAGLLVTNETLWSTDPRVGLDPSSTADQTARLQAFANMLTQSSAQSVRVGYLVPGAYLKSAPINFASATGHHPFTLLGRGSKGGLGAGSVIVDAVDGGAGAYSLNITGTAAFHIEGISLVGATRVASPGSAPWQMRALCLPTYCTVRDFSSSGYFAGMTMMGDHMLIEDVDVRGNGYGIDFGPNAVTQGDVILKRGRLGNCSIAAIGVARSGSLAGARFKDVDCSSSPYGIKRYDDGTGANVPNWITGVDFENITAASIGNAVLCNTIDASGIAGMSFDQGFFGNPGLYSGPADPSGPQVAAWYSTGNITDVSFGKSLPSSTNGKPGILAPAILRVTAPSAVGIPAACAAGARPFAFVGNQNGSHVGGSAFGHAHGSATLVVPLKSQAVIRRGACVYPSSLYDVFPYNGSGRVVGIAAHDVNAGDIVHAVTSGVEQPVLNTSGQVIAANALLVPHFGGGVSAGGYATGQVIGRSLGSISPNSVGPAELHIGANL